MCHDNSIRIENTYNDMVKKLSEFPKNEKELVELKNHIAEHEVNLAKLKSEVLAILKFLKILEDY